MKATMPKDNAEDAMQCDAMRCDAVRLLHWECYKSEVKQPPPQQQQNRSKCCMANAIVKQ